MQNFTKKKKKWELFKKKRSLKTSQYLLKILVPKNAFGFNFHLRDIETFKIFHLYCKRPDIVKYSRQACFAD